jgi:predicted XRE-type DNA-binding protein
MAKCKNNAKQVHDFQLEAGSGNVFKDLGFSDEEAVNLSIRTQLASALKDLIEEAGMSQRDMANLLGIKQPRIAEIVKMKIQYFSVDTLLKYLDRLDRSVSVTIKRKNRKPAA